ncbi:hypothetical protein [Hymenobacter sp. BT730]|uniref:hypothetical protein n=1 Tax=Hymenobacter sp. BT730 TaxID=3063332 RepID=UPI0026DF6B26|nr:hypothetical protein [Hymenobacter sp. BT730]
MLALYNTPYLRIYYDGFAHTLESEWLRRPTSEELRLGLQTGLVLAREYHVRGWISNLRRMPGISPDDEAWVRTEWLMQFVELDITHMAIVESRSQVIRTGVIELLERAGTLAPLSTGYFASRAAARQWIMGGQLIPGQPLSLAVATPTPVLSENRPSL